MRIAVVGARGQLGAAVVHECSAQHEVIAYDRSSLDVTDEGAVAQAVQRARPDAIVNCTGYNAVDAAEDHPVEALSVNAIAVRTLARAARDVRAAFVHYGTDFVFDGTESTPMTEEDQPNPRSVYAMSKLLGEWLAAAAPRWYVLRVESLFARAPGAAPAKGSVAAIVNALKSGAAPKVFVDRVVSPTSVVDAAMATRLLLERELPVGLYHCVNSGHGTWLEVAEEIARLLGVEEKFEQVCFADVRLPAARPQYCALSNRKLASVGIVMPTWQDALARYIEAER
jgi:dTDP-4-dehydrorhamnose reductase